ncbi:MAG: disulfide bond formation protein B [Chlamydiia bacterium]|nr:disulfide bond formation protein B [Chlamydiia bacterium]
MILRYGLYLAWLISCFAMLGSLFFSEVLGFEPCHLCWYERICIYPLTIILGIAAYRGDAKVIPYVLPLVGIGIALVAYQVAIQAFPGWEPINLCPAGPSCTTIIDIGVEVVTIPLLALGAFIAEFILLAVVWRQATVIPCEVNHAQS